MEGNVIIEKEDSRSGEGTRPERDLMKVFKKCPNQSRAGKVISSEKIGKQRSKIFIL